MFCRLAICLTYQHWLVFFSPIFYWTGKCGLSVILKSVVFSTIVSQNTIGLGRRHCSHRNRNEEELRSDIWSPQGIFQSFQELISFDYFQIFGLIDVPLYLRYLQTHLRSDQILIFIALRTINFNFLDCFECYRRKPKIICVIGLYLLITAYIFERTFDFIPFLLPSQFQPIIFLFNEMITIAIFTYIFFYRKILNEIMQPEWVVDIVLGISKAEGKGFMLEMRSQLCSIEEQKTSEISSNGN